MILSEKLVNFILISREIAEITGIGMNGISQFRAELNYDPVKC